MPIIFSCILQKFSEALTIATGRDKTALFVGDMIIDIKIQRSVDKLLELIRHFHSVVGYKRNTQKSIVFLTYSKEIYLIHNNNKILQKQ